MKKLFLLIIVINLIAIAPVDSVEGYIKIGMICPLTGPYAFEGKQMKRNVELLVNQINKKGGLLGHDVKLIIEDDAGDPKKSVKAAKKLVSKNVIAAIGSYTSLVTKASQKIFAKAKIIQIANGAFDEKLTEKKLPYFFRICQSNGEQAQMAASMFKKNNYNQIAILHDKSRLSIDIASKTRKLLNNEETRVIFFDGITPGKKDYTTILNKIKAKDPELVFFTGYYPEAGLLLRQKNKMNWDVPFIGTATNKHPDLVEIAGKKAAAGFRLLSMPEPKDLSSKLAQKFFQTFKKNYDDNPVSIWGILAGDGFRVIAKSIERTSSTQAKKIANFLHNKLTNFQGVTGKITFNKKGERLDNLYKIYKVNKNGNFIID